MTSSSRRVKIIYNVFCSNWLWHIYPPPKVCVFVLTHASPKHRQTCRINEFGCRIQIPNTGWCLKIQDCWHRSCVWLSSVSASLKPTPSQKLLFLLGFSFPCQLNPAHLVHSWKLALHRFFVAYLVSVLCVLDTVRSASLETSRCGNHARYRSCRSARVLPSIRRLSTSCEWIPDISTVFVGLLFMLIIARFVVLFVHLKIKTLLEF